jgi:hypothetical protein
MTIPITLYSTAHCHLCDTAQALLVPYANNTKLKIVDIAEDDILLAQYGVQIPVLFREDTKCKLYWPFDANNIKAFLN